IQGRDGIYANWAHAAGQQSSVSLQSYIKHVLQGDSPFLPSSPRSFVLGAARRALGFKNPLAVFNQALKEGIGPIDTGAMNNGFRKMLYPADTVHTAGPIPDDSYVTATPANPQRLAIGPGPATNLQGVVSRGPTKTFVIGENKTALPSGERLA